MEAYLEAAWNHANIPAEPGKLHPLGDYVLVRVIPEPEVTASGIVLPQTKKENLSPRIGEVIAAGPGDKVFVWICNYCTKIWDWPGEPMAISKKSIDSFRDANWEMEKLTTTKGPGRCKACGGTDWELYGWGRHPMHVKPGDRVLYWRTYANEVILNDELFQIIHEEQHIVGVLEN